MYWELFLARLAAYGVRFAACFRPIDVYLITMFLGSGMKVRPVLTTSKSFAERKVIVGSSEVLEKKRRRPENRGSALFPFWCF